MDVAIGHIFEAVIVILAGLALWSLRSYLKERTEIQRAPCGFMTLADIELYCQQRSDAYTKTITDKVDNLIEKFDDKIESVDRRLTSHSERLRGLEKQLVETTAVLKLITSRELRNSVRDALEEAK